MCVVNNDSLVSLKTYSRWYYLNEALVCKEVFMSTFGISSGRIDRILKKKADYALVSTDGRGKHGNHPSVALEVKKSLDSLVQRIPKY